ncbi:hypothetical protein FXO37_13065 [Capsicum annuum]|nr:hypothetical protein FXO37_13065 [Capsicum annuum]
MGHLTGARSVMELPIFFGEGQRYVEGQRRRYLRAAGGAGVGPIWLHFGSQQGLLVVRGSPEHGFFGGFKEREKEKEERSGAGVGWSISGGSPVTVMCLLWCI